MTLVSDIRTKLAHAGFVAETQETNLAARLATADTEKYERAEQPSVVCCSRKRTLIRIR
jgi:hypothetical protein